ncbi:MAG TPA: hypothetical protein VFI99_17575 [Nocardioides sp.]|nr:hypothetical protein [Nocardioides sp.]
MKSPTTGAHDEQVWPQSAQKVPASASYAWVMAYGGAGDGAGE